MTLHFDVLGSRSLSNSQKGLVKELLATRINQEGVLRISSSKERTQLANRRAAVNRFIELMSGAFAIRKPRKPTRPPAVVAKNRVDSKRRRGTLKQARSPAADDA